MHPLLQRALIEGTPLIDGDTATFLWQGVDAPVLLGDFNWWGLDYAVAPMVKVDDDLWSLTVSVSQDTYLQYRFMMEERFVPDPLNRQPPAIGGMGPEDQYNTLRMPFSRPSPYAIADAALPHGTLTTHQVSGDHLLADGVRTVHLYRPPSVSGPLPLLVVWDGQDYLHQGMLIETVENLYHDHRILPFAMALIEHGGPARFVEYCCNDATIALLTRVVLPVARQHLPLLDPAEMPGSYAIMGASMAGLMALYTGLRLPHIFGHVLCQSGSFGLSFGDDRARSIMHDLIEYAPRPEVDIWMDVGTLEWLYPRNRQMVELMQAHGYTPTFSTFTGGHNYTAWRDHYWRGLLHHFARDSHEK